MQQFDIRETEFKGVYIVTPFYCEDERGYFLKSFERRVFSQLPIHEPLSEVFESLSKKNVVRGMHFQYGVPQAKLVRALDGEILDVVVDIRSESETFGKHFSIKLNSEDDKALFIPQGFAHGFLTLSETARVSYTCWGDYNKEGDSGIYWKDPDLNIEWPVTEADVIVSLRDKNLQSFENFKRTGCLRRS